MNKEEIPTLSCIIKTVAESFGLTARHLSNGDNTAVQTDARQMYCYIASLFDYTAADIVKAIDKPLRRYKSLMTGAKKKRSIDERWRDKYNDVKSALFRHGFVIGKPTRTIPAGTYEPFVRFTEREDELMKRAKVSAVLFMYGYGSGQQPYDHVKPFQGRKSI